ncbi:MAG TPA: FUSC family protein [Bryobacteraceae bacterium]|jgi:uncharacterized membrane protein YccC|nr:FUSC family protein [Bryobacteraceae bacterium]
MPNKPDGAWRAFWRTLTKVEHSKIYNRIAFRNAVAVALPLAVGIAVHNPLAGVAVTTGALNVSYSDGPDPYKSRARRMLLWTFLGGCAVFVGSATGSISWLAVLVVAAWAFLAGLALAISPKTGDLGLNTLVIVIIFGARGAMNLEGAAAAGGLVILGGLLQTTLALLFWPLRNNNPERRVLGMVYAELAKELDPSKHDVLDRQLRNPSQQVQDTLNALGSDHSIEGERFRVLFDQAERLRRSTFVLQSLRKGIELPQDAEIQRYIDDLLELSSKLLEAVGESLSSEGSGLALSVYATKLEQLLDAGLASTQEKPAAPVAEEIAKAMDVLAGQLRIVLSLAGHATEEEYTQPAKEEATAPWQMTVRDALQILRANLTWSSTYFRHAIRMSVCVTIGDVIARVMLWQRTYWLPMTVAVILKPDFTTTFSRGVLRFSGTFGGLLLATLLYHLLPTSSPAQLAVSQLFLVGLFTFALRSIGAANYGVFSVSISGLIVFLVAATGVPPKDVVLERALNTSAGGVLALLAYAVWPTWERMQVNELMAGMLDAARGYFHEVTLRLTGKVTDISGLDSARTAWRRARSNAEVSVDRVTAEPGTPPEKILTLTAMLASSHALVHAVAGLDASLAQQPRTTTPEALSDFARDVEFTLYFLAEALRGSRAASDTLPKLREDYRRLVEMRDRFLQNHTFLIMETDRLVVSLNTLREQVMRFVDGS